MIYSFSDATLERELGKRGNIVLTAPPGLTHTHKDIFFFFPLKDIFKNSLPQSMLCVSMKAHQAPLLRPWGATNHGPFLPGTQEDLTLNICITRKVWKTKQVLRKGIGIWDDQSSLGKSVKPDFLNQTNKPAGPAMVLC